MMTREDFERMTTDDFRHSVEQFLTAEPTSIALKKGLAHASLVATQVKYLQRAAKKLPSYYAVRAVIPSLSFEQSSSEQSASMRRLSAGTALDLTCGLGVDTLAMSKSFDRVVAVERNEILADVARYNFALMDVRNVEVVCASAEEFLARTDETFDTIFVDPDRRSATGQKLYRLEDCSPDVVVLMPRMRALAKRVVLKCSPLFDVDEAFRLFGSCAVEVVSVGGECKEVVIEIGDGIDSKIVVSVFGSRSIVFDTSKERPVPLAMPERVEYLVVPDVALQKSRKAVEYYTEQGVALEGDNHYGFCDVRPPSSMLGKVYEIVSIVPLKEFVGGGKATIMHRATSMSTEQIAKRLKIKQSGARLLALCSIYGSMFVAELKNS